MSVLLSLRVSTVSPRVLSRLPLERDSRQNKMTTCIKTCRKNSILVKDGQQYQVLKLKHVYGRNSQTSSRNEKTFKKNCREIQRTFNFQYISYKVLPLRHNYNKAEHVTDDITQYGEKASFAFRAIKIKVQTKTKSRNILHL